MPRWFERDDLGSIATAKPHLVAMLSAGFVAPADERANGAASLFQAASRPRHGEFALFSSCSGMPLTGLGV